jgi:predicted nucleic acid-binding protein
MTSASSGFLVDSNVLVYAVDPRDLDKQRIAARSLEWLIERQLAVLSVQCLSEFFNVATRKLPERLPVNAALQYVQRFAQTCQVLDLTPAAVLEGCRASAQHSLSVWDALIWATAKLNQVQVVLTEDMQHGRFLEGVLFQNPFAPAFEMSQLVAT